MKDLPPLFADWFARQGWVPHPHQLALLEAQIVGRFVRREIDSGFHDLAGTPDE